MIRNLLFLYRHKRACKRLQRLTEERRNSFAIQDYRKRRAAALQGWRA